MDEYFIASRIRPGNHANVDSMEIESTDALVAVDVQNDFCPGGALAIDSGDEIVPVVNLLGSKFVHVILTQDWHPLGHISFASAHPGARPYETTAAPYGDQALWPDHCVQNTPGAGFHPGLHIPHAELILRKGFRQNIDSYSVFLENDHVTPTGLAGYLRERGLTRLFFCGLAYDFCVRHSAIDGTGFDFECIVIEDATRAVSLPGSVEETDQAFNEAGIQRIQATELLKP
jgi:nicotinamidase/pyrazinamidase